MSRILFAWEVGANLGHVWPSSPGLPRVWTTLGAGLADSLTHEGAPLREKLNDVLKGDPYRLNAEGFAQRLARLIQKRLQEESLRRNRNRESSDILAEEAPRELDH